MRCDRCTDHPCSTGNPCIPSDPEKAYLDREERRILQAAGVGHDALFLRHSKAWTVPLVVKDRRLGHNPVAALTCPYIRRKLGREESRP